MIFLILKFANYYVLRLTQQCLFFVKECIDLKICECFIMSSKMVFNELFVPSLKNRMCYMVARAT